MVALQVGLCSCARQAVNTEDGICYHQSIRTRTLSLWTFRAKQYIRSIIGEQAKKKRIRYRLDVDFNSFEGSYAFITRLNCTKPRFSSPETTQAKNWSATVSYVEPLGVPARPRRSKTDHARCENGVKQQINVARMLQSCIHGRQAVFHDFFCGEKAYYRYFYTSIFQYPSCANRR